MLTLIACLSLPSPVSNLGSRRAVLLGGAAALAPPSFSWASTRSDLTPPGSEERCEGGDGAACERLAGGNELIKKLQAKSLENRQRRVNELVEKTVRQLNYGEYFDSMDKNMVMLPDGSYKLLDMEEYLMLRKQGRIKVGSVDELLPAGAQASTPPLNVEAATASPNSELSYDEFKAAINSRLIEGVVFEAPKGDVAFVLIGSQSRRVELKPRWKVVEASNLLQKNGIINNYEAVR